MMFPESQSTFLTVIDLQERLCGAIAGSQEILPRVKVLIEGAKALNIPIVVTEQYPPLDVGRKEIGKCQNDKQQHCQQVGQQLLEVTHHLCSFSNFACKVTK